ncbi:MAG: diphthine synthase [Candidatus Diapherotrites archaeon]|nr:diphthine synthase [Candidatus Diapherotrites archaeon]
MFYLISAGLGPKQITVEAFDAIKSCEELYFDTYTSLCEGMLEKLEKLAGKKIVPLGRIEVEGLFFEKLKTAKEKNIGLIVLGNALFATTHIQLLIDCKELGVDYKVVQGISIQNYVGLTGLSSYRFGETVSIVLPEEKYAPTSFYEKLARNYKNKLHTLCLLDIKDGKQIDAHAAIERLLEIEKKRKSKIMKQAHLIAICCAGNDREQISVGKASELLEQKIPTPTAIIVCAEMSDNERKAIKALYGKEV